MRRAASDGSEPRGLLPLTPVEFHILLSLTDDARHGYAIMREVNERTSGVVRLYPGTLYANVKRLLDDGLVREVAAEPEPNSRDERRRYYRLTPRGRKAAAMEVARLESIVLAARANGLAPGAA